MEIERLRYGMEARERERTRWAREIHDETVQGLGALRLKLAHARDQREQTSGRESSTSGGRCPRGHRPRDRRAAPSDHRARPAALDDLGLVPALQALARRAQAIDGLEVQTEIDLERPRRERVGCGAREHDLPRGARGAHQRQPPRSGHPRGGQRDGSADGAAVRVAVADDGRGLPERRGLGPRGDGLEGGFGMSGMRERAELVGGELELAAGAGRGGWGTTVRLTVPLAGRPVEARRPMRAPTPSARRPATR